MCLLCYQDMPVMKKCDGRISPKITLLKLLKINVQEVGKSKPEMQTSSC